MESIDNNLLSQVIKYNHERYLNYLNGVYEEPNKDFERILKARYMKVSRVKKKLVYMLRRCKYIYFCTFTFSDKYINKSERTKRDLIKNALNQIKDVNYILNIDYGKKTEREHYHAIVGLNELDLNSDALLNELLSNPDNVPSIYLDLKLKESYPCYCYSEIAVTNDVNDIKKLTKYINKLTNHCLKDSTKNQRIYYNFKGYESLATNCSDVREMFIRDLTALDLLELF